MNEIESTKLITTSGQIASPLIDTYFINASGGFISFNLYPIGANGQVITIKRIDNSINQQVQIQSLFQNIDGKSSVFLNTGGVLVLKSFSNQWRICNNPPVNSYFYAYKNDVAGAVITFPANTVIPIPDTFTIRSSDIAIGGSEELNSILKIGAYTKLV